MILIITGLVLDWGRRDAIAPISEAEVTIKVDLPKVDQEIKSPIKISGVAKGTWFFEGSFPINLVDSNGTVIASGLATSAKDWMTEDFIDFSSIISFEKPTSTKHAILILKKDNPSGDPDLDESIFVPVVLR